MNRFGAVALTGVAWAVGAALSTVACAWHAPASATITVDSAVHLQTMMGWEATAFAGQDDARFEGIRDTLFALAVNDLGVNRLRLEVRSGVEQRRDYWREGQTGRLTGNAYRCSRYQTANDNDDPHRIDRAGFQFSELDDKVARVVLPFRRVLEAKGERLHLNVTYVSFMTQCPSGARWDHGSPEEYAEFALATVVHLRDRWGLVPDTWEMILEPDVTGRWSGRSLGEALIATAARFREGGLENVGFVAPSTSSMQRAVTWFDELAQVPGAARLLREISYHRYGGVSDSALLAIGTRAEGLGIGAAMLEHINSGYEDLHADVARGEASAWSQFVLAGPNPQYDGGHYYMLVERGTQWQVSESSRTRWFKQYFRYVRLGARRVGATSDREGADPLAFENADGRFAVVVKALRATSVAVRGLPPGTYGTTYTTSREALVALPDTTIAAGGVLIARLPAAGVLTVFAR